MHSGPHRVMFCMLLATVAATLIIYMVERRLGRRKQTDTELLFDLARTRGCSEYDVFAEAAEVWNLPEDRIKEDFKNYMFSGVIPHYVRSFIRTETVERDGSEDSRY